MNMKQFRHIIAVVAATVGLQAAAQAAPYKLDVGDFSELKVSDGINVEYFSSTDSAGMAYFECEPDMARMLMFTNKKNTLTIQVATDGAAVKNLPLIRVCSMTLHKVTNSGDSTVTVCRTLPVRDFTGTLIGNGSLLVKNLRAQKSSFSIKTGNGHLVVTGTARTASLKNVGTGTLEASGLQSEETKCNVVGTGAIDCNASASLTVSGAGSGKVYYGGSPSKISNHSIGIKAISVDNKQEIK